MFRRDYPNVDARDGLITIVAKLQNSSLCMLQSTTLNELNEWNFFLLFSRDKNHMFFIFLKNFRFFCDDLKLSLVYEAKGKKIYQNMLKKSESSSLIILKIIDLSKFLWCSIHGCCSHLHVVLKHSSWDVFEVSYWVGFELEKLHFVCFATRKNSFWMSKTSFYKERLALLKYTEYFTFETIHYIESQFYRNLIWYCVII